MDPLEILPEELVIMIFSMSSWRHLQKTCTLVSKNWFNFIRKTETLSSEFATSNVYKISQKSWPVLKTIHLQNFYTKYGLKGILDIFPSLKFISMETGHCEITSSLFSKEYKFSVNDIKNMPEDLEELYFGLGKFRTFGILRKSEIDFLRFANFAR